MRTAPPPTPLDRRRGKEQFLGSSSASRRTLNGASRLCPGGTAIRELFWVCRYLHPRSALDLEGGAGDRGRRPIVNANEPNWLDMTLTLTQSTERQIGW